MSVEDALRDHIRNSNLALNRIAVETGIAAPSLWQFMNNPSRTLSQVNLDRLAGYFGLEIVPATVRSKGKETV